MLPLNPKKEFATGQHYQKFAQCLRLQETLSFYFFSEIQANKMECGNRGRKFSLVVKPHTVIFFQHNSSPTNSNSSRNLASLLNNF